MQEQAGVDIYEKKNQPSNATGGVQLGPESAAFAAVQRAAALAGPSMIHCDLCNVRPRSCSGLLFAHHPSMPPQGTASAEGHLQKGASRTACQ